MKVLWQRDFESGRLCGMNQREDDDFNWADGNGNNDIEGTAPDQAAQGQWYMYVRTSQPQRQDGTAM